MTDAVPAAPGYRDRSRRLSVFGVLVLLAGVASVLFGLLHVALPWLRPLHSSSETLPIDVRSLVMGVVLYSLLGAVLIIAGVGSMRRRRWTRPIMLVIGWTWMLSGALSLLVVWGMLDDLLVLATAEVGELPATVALVFKAVVMTLGLLCGVLFPAVLLVAFHDRHVAPTCAAADPQPGWSDTRPVPVVGLAAGLGLAALLSLPLALRPVVPVFGVLATGVSGLAAVLLSAGGAAWLARSVYRLERRGWWGTTALFVVIGISACVTFARVPAVDLYREMGYPEEQLERLGGAGIGGWTLAACAAVTVASLIYMLRIKRYFDDPT